MEPLSRSGSPTAPEYPDVKPPSRSGTPEIVHSGFGSPPVSPSLVRPGTPNPGGYTAATGFDSAWDFQKMPRLPDSEDDAVAAAVDKLAGMHFSNPQANATNSQPKDLMAVIRKNDAIMASMQAREDARLAAKKVHEAQLPLNGLSYEGTLAYVQKNPTILEHVNKKTEDTCLHECIKDIKNNPGELVPLIIFLTVLLELGANREIPNADGLMPAELALELNIPIAFDVLAGIEFNKNTLIELARTHQKTHPKLLECLTGEPSAVMQETAPRALSNVANNNNDYNVREPSEAVLKEARELAGKIDADPRDVYAQVKALFQKHDELLTAKFRKTEDTVMHRAVRAFTAQPQHLLGIFEVLVLLELKANKDATNSDGNTPLDLAKKAPCMILVQLLEHPNPTIEVLTNLAMDHELVTLTAWTLN